MASINVNSTDPMLSRGELIGKLVVGVVSDARHDL